MSEPTNLTIEPGKFYRTRNGYKARIYATDGGDTKNLIHGAILKQDDSWLSQCWHAGGKYFNKCQCDDDIVSEWIDAPVVNWSAMPAWANFVAKDSDGAWFWYSYRPNYRVSDGNWEGDQPIESRTWGAIPIVFSPTFTGPWTASLVERPTT